MHWPSIGRCQGKHVLWLCIHPPASWHHRLPNLLSPWHAPLPSFLVRVEDGYCHPNPYHNRTHAADVLRSLHVLATRGGILQQRQPAGTPAHLSGSLLMMEQCGVMTITPVGDDHLSSPSLSSGLHTELPATLLTAGRSNSSSTVSGRPHSEDRSGALGVVAAEQLLTMYLAAAVHDYEHKGVNNDFLIKSNDIFAVRASVRGFFTG